MQADGSGHPRHLRLPESTVHGGYLPSDQNSVFRRVQKFLSQPACDEDHVSGIDYYDHAISFLSYHYCRAYVSDAALWPRPTLTAFAKDRMACGRRDFISRTAPQSHRVVSSSWKGNNSLDLEVWKRRRLTGRPSMAVGRKHLMAGT